MTVVLVGAATHDMRMKKTCKKTAKYLLGSGPAPGKRS
jgi:hypothetical protein